MSITTNEREVWLDKDDITSHDTLDNCRGDILEFLGKYYEYDEDNEELGYPKLYTPYRDYTILFTQEDKFWLIDSTDFAIIHLEIKLPDDKAAKELADILGGSVEKGLEGIKTYRITYRNEVYVHAETEKEAKAAFENMSRTMLNSKSEFVELVSVEEQD